MSDEKTFDLDGFLKDMKFEGEEVETAKKLFAKPERQQELKDRGQRQSEFDRRFNAAKADLAKQQEELEATVADKEAALVAEKKSLGEYKTKLERAVAEERIKSKTLEIKKLKAEELYGIDIDSIDAPEIAELTKQLQAKEEPDPKQTKKSFGEEDAYKLVESGLDIQAEIEDIADDWRELNPGKRFPRKEFLDTARKNARKGINLRQTAEQLYEFSTVRDTKRVADIEAKAEEKYRKKYEEDLTQELSKRGLETPRTDEKPRSTFWRGREEKATERSQDDRVRLTQQKLAERAKA